MKNKKQKIKDIILSQNKEQNDIYHCLTKEEIKEEFKEQSNLYIDDRIIFEITTKLMDNDLIDYEIEAKDISGEFYFEQLYYSNKINKNIIINEGVKFYYDNLDEFIDNLLDFQKDLEDFKNKFNL